MPSIRLLDLTNLAALSPAREFFNGLLAFAIDYLVIAIYIALLAAAGFALSTLRGTAAGPPGSFGDRVRLQLLGFALLTLPVILYFTLLEASRRQATIGKRALGLRVVGVAGASIARRRSLLRSAIKFLPWELSHTAIWHVPGQPFVSPPGPLSWTVWAIAFALVGVWMATLFTGARRPPYDRIAGTRVIRGAPEPCRPRAEPGAGTIPA